MAHLALYREWRPKTFDEVVEQKQAVYALRQSVISGQIAHAYLFSGTRGTGKTTMAKIFSRAINCLQPQSGNPCNQCAICRAMLDGNLMDVLEMDAASNNSVDNIRRICDEVVFMPSQARYKVYIIDEVHMLSTGAFNALLKTLEEPPAHAVFILATTEPHRIPATILSRCQRYDFRRIPVESMAARLAEIAAADQIQISGEALQTIAILADGALRDAISLLDQARAGFPGIIGRDDVLSLAGVVRDEFLHQVASALIAGQIPILLTLVEQLVMSGRDLARFVTDLAQHFRNILVCQVSADPQLLIRATSTSLADMRQLAALVDSARLVALIRGLSALLSDLRWAADGRTALEIGLIRLTGPLESSGSPPAQAAGTVAPRAPAATDPGKSSRTAPGSAVVAPAAVAPMPGAAAVRARPPIPPAKQQDEPPLPEPPPESPSELPPDPLMELSSEPPPDPAPELAAALSPAPLPEQLSAPDPQPALSPDSSPEAQTQPSRDPAPEAQTQPVTTDLAADGPQPAAVALDASAIWQKLQTELLEAGHMTLYLFSRPARPVLCSGKLQVLFESAEAVNYQEINRPAALKILRAAAARAAGIELDIQPMIAGPDQAAGCPVAPDDDWIRKVKETAHAMGIPIKMED